MKLDAKTLLMPTALVTILLSTAGVPTLAETIALRIGPNQPMTLSGQSGGSVSTPDCGKISATPNHVLNIAERIDSMTVRVQATGGQPTLLVDGPDGRFCAVTTGGNQPEIPGLWMPGQYKIYVGDLSGGQYAYSISIAQ
jgi:hypothetical protein